MVRILAFDGGGMKGLYSAVLVERLLARCPRLLEETDLFAGTSTGALLALALADGRTPSELLGLYRRDGARIFDDSLWDDLRDLGHAVGADYGSGGLQRVLEREFGARTLGQLKKRVLVPSFDLDAPPDPAQGRPRCWKPKFFHNFPGPDSDASWRIVDVALASSAAPTFFPSHRGFVDGALVANNPSMAALAQIVSARGGGHALDEVQLLSIGTGGEPKFVAGERLDWGFGQWARPLVSILISGSMGVADFQCGQLLGPRYRRLDGWLERAVEMDDVRPATLDFLERSARALDLGNTLAWLARLGWGGTRSVGPMRAA